MEQFEAIRRDHAREGLSIRELVLPLEARWKDLERTITGHAGTVGERLDQERRLLNNFRE